MRYSIIFGSTQYAFLGPDVTNNSNIHCHSLKLVYECNSSTSSSFNSLLSHSRHYQLRSLQFSLLHHSIETSHPTPYQSSNIAPSLLLQQRASVSLPYCRKVSLLLHRQLIDASPDDSHPILHEHSCIAASSLPHYIASAPPPHRQQADTDIGSSTLLTTAVIHTTLASLHISTIATASVLLPHLILYQHSYTKSSPLRRRR